MRVSRVFHVLRIQVSMCIAINFKKLQKKYLQDQFLFYVHIILRHIEDNLNSKMSLLEMIMRRLSTNNFQNLQTDYIRTGYLIFM